MSDNCKVKNSSLSGSFCTAEPFSVKEELKKVLNEFKLSLKRFSDSIGQDIHTKVVLKVDRPHLKNARERKFPSLSQKKVIPNKFFK